MGITILRTPLNVRRQKEYLAFLTAAGLRDEEDADYIAWMTDEDGVLVGCGSLAGHTLKQVAVAPAIVMGVGAMTDFGPLIANPKSLLLGAAAQLGIFRLFLCTKPVNRPMLTSMGFHTVVESSNAILMENRRNGAADFVASLPRYEGLCGAVVCNCDPFTLGHRHLIEYAAAHCDHLYVFAVAEKGSMFSPEERLSMIRKGTEDLANCHVLSSDLYLVSRATFPAYFIKDKTRADLVKADLDIAFFAEHLAPALNITARFVGEEPFSPVTAAYNERMKELLPAHGIELIEIPRAGSISASRVRELIQAGEIEQTRDLVPESTYETILRHTGTDA